jgi:hypothetical protein
MYVCMHERVNHYVFQYVCMYVCVYACMYGYTYVYTYKKNPVFFLLMPQVISYSSHHTQRDAAAQRAAWSDREKKN